jgi:hypothetical protein
VAAPTSRLPDSTCDTVVGLTPARVATWAIVARDLSGITSVAAATSRGGPERRLTGRQPSARSYVSNRRKTI